MLSQQLLLPGINRFLPKMSLFVVNRFDSTLPWIQRFQIALFGVHMFEVGLTDLKIYYVGFID